jgi:hypothetical protein
MDLATLIAKHKIIECGYGNDTQRIAPLHSVDPNINYSLLKWLVPQFYGKHELFTIYLKDFNKYLA